MKGSTKINKNKFHKTMMAPSSFRDSNFLGQESADDFAILQISKLKGHLYPLLVGVLFKFLPKYSLRPRLIVTLWPSMSFKNCKKKLVEKVVECETHFFYWLYNKMWVMWVSGTWDLLTIYSKSELWQLLRDRSKWKRVAINRGRRE